MELWWWDLWRPGSPAPVNTEPWLATLRLTAFPDLSDITGAQLRQAILKAPKSKAPGADGWCYQDLRDWPTPLLELLSLFFKAVETKGQWPARFNLALVAMLHKGGTSELDDFRPIVLLSTVYRLWAGLRSRVLRSWLSANGLLPPTNGRGADTQAYELSLRLALARLSGVTVSGLAIDWSKCYDRLPLSVLQDLSIHLGLPERLWRPMVNMYSRPRAVLLQGGIGQALAPTHGLPPGCPCAVDWLTLVMYMLTQATTGIGPTVQSRPYVDDITSDVTTLVNAEAVAAVFNMERIAREFGGAFGLVLHERKSKRFSTSREVRAELSQLPGPKVVFDFVDLGVLQAASNTRTSAESVRRAELALAKMSRISSVALPFHQRCLLTSSSGVPTAMFGMAAQPLSNGVVSGLRAAAFDSIWKSGRRSAPEIVFGLLAPRRADPLAVSIFEPWRLVRGCLASGLISDQEFYHLLLGSRDVVGPVAALRGSLRRSGCTLLMGPRLLDPAGKIIPVSAPARQVHDFLQEALWLTQLKTLCKRRPFFQEARGGLDVDLTLRLIRSGKLCEDVAASLRLLMAGGSITQAVASKWSPGGPLCPHCGLDAENLAHRLWLCPCWDSVRRRCLGPVSPALLRCWVSPLTSLSGLVPSDPLLSAAQRAAEQSASWPPSRALGNRVWGDGSATDPTDRLLCRAAWAAVGHSLPGFHVLAAGGVPGRQTSGRAELCTLVWVSRCQFVGVLVSDCKGVLAGMASWQDNGIAPALLQGANGDLWCLVLQLVNMVWIRAHLSPSVAEVAGFAALDHAGNATADHAALAHARTLQPPLNHRLARGKLGKAVRLVQVMIAEVQIAAIAANRKRLPKIKFKRKAKRRLLQLRRPTAIKSNPVRPPPILGPGPPEALHLLAIAYGPPSEVVSSSRGNVFPWMLHCQRCRRSVSGTGRWSAFAKTLCTASPGYLSHSWSEGPHALTRVAGGWACARCGLTASPSRRAAASRAACPVPELLGSDGQPVITARPWLAQYTRLAVSWRLLLRAPPSPPPAAAVARPAFVLRWASHWVLSSPLGSCCLRCGLSARRRDPRRLLGTPCPGVVPASAALSGPLLAGRFDQVLAAAPPAWVLRARELGWVPVPTNVGVRDDG